MTGHLIALDLRLVEAARSLLVRLRNRFGSDKFAAIRDAHLAQAGIGTFWAWFGLGLSTFLAFVGLGLVAINVVFAERAARRIGSADTARGFERAMREASASYHGSRTTRIVNLLADALFVATFVWVSALTWKAGPGWASDPLTALAIMSAYGCLGSFVAYLEAAPPPAPGSERREEAFSALPEGSPR